MKKIIMALPIFLLFACGEDVEVKTDDKKEVANQEQRKEPKPKKEESSATNEKVLTGNISITVDGETKTFTKFSKKYTGGMVAGNVISLKVVGEDEKFSATLGVVDDAVNTRKTGAFEKNPSEANVQFMLNNAGFDGKTETIVIREGTMTIASLKKDGFQIRVTGKASLLSKMNTDEMFDVTAEFDISGCKVGGM